MAEDGVAGRDEPGLQRLEGRTVGVEGVVDLQPPLVGGERRPEPGDALPGRGQPAHLVGQPGDLGLGGGERRLCRGHRGVGPVALGQRAGEPLLELGGGAGGGGERGDGVVEGVDPGGEVGRGPGVDLDPGARDRQGVDPGLDGGCGPFDVGPARRTAARCPASPAARVAASRRATCSRCRGSVASRSWSRAAERSPRRRRSATREASRRASWARRSAPSAASTSARAVVSRVPRSVAISARRAGTAATGVSDSAGAPSDPSGGPSAGDPDAPTPVRASSRRASSADSARRAVSSAPPLVRRVSASQASTSEKTEMSKSRSRTSRRSSGVARRNVAKSPWGRSTTRENWASPSPTTSLTRSATSSLRVLSATHDAAAPLLEDDAGLHLERALTALLGAHELGGALDAQPPARPRSSSSRTVGTAPGAAWSLRSPRLLRAPGTSA